MESQSESHIEPGYEPTDQYIEGREVDSKSRDFSTSTTELRPIHETTERDQVPLEPSATEIENGAMEAAALVEEYTGKKLPPEPMDEETKRILYEIHRSRQAWTPSMERTARCTLQTLFPDIGGSRVNGPL